MLHYVRISQFVDDRKSGCIQFGTIKNTMVLKMFEQAFFVGLAFVLFCFGG